jgi:fructose-specific phosphotransferase system IIC component
VYALPVIQAFILGVYLGKFVKKVRSQKKKLSQIHRYSLNVVFIPLIGFVFIFINAIVVLIVAIDESR